MLSLASFPAHFLTAGRVTVVHHVQVCWGLVYRLVLAGTGWYWLVSTHLLIATVPLFTLAPLEGRSVALGWTATVTVTVLVTVTVTVTVTETVTVQNCATMRFIIFCYYYSSYYDSNDYQHCHYDTHDN